MSKQRMGVASDHAGLELKRVLLAELEKRGFEVQDFGTQPRHRATIRTSPTRLRVPLKRAASSRACSCVAPEWAFPSPPIAMQACAPWSAASP